MELILQLWIAAPATALLLLFLWQLPAVTALRWWFYACSIGLISLFLAWLPAAVSTERLLTLILLIVALLCGCAQIHWVARGLLCLRRHRQVWTYVSVALVCSLLLVLLPLAAFVGPVEQRMQWVVASRSLILPILCGILGFSILTNSANSQRAVWMVSALLMLGFAGGLMQAALPLLPPGLTGPMRPALTPLEAIGQCGVALAMACMVHGEAKARDAKLRDRTETLLRLVDSADFGICEVDARGCVTFVNRTASEMFAKKQQALIGRPIDELLSPADEESTQAIRDFILRPVATVKQAKASVLSANGGAISAGLSSVPILHDGRVASAVVTLRDTTQREAADRFLKIRNELLEMIARNKPFEEVSRLLAITIEGLLPGFCCAVLVCEGDSFRVAAAPTISDGLRAAINGLPSSRFPVQRNLKAEAGSEAGSQDWESALRQSAETHGFGGTWTEPLVSRANEFLGVVVLIGTERALFSHQHRDTLSQAARLVALAVENHRSLERLLHQGHHDALTGLPNRLLLSDRLRQALARAQRTASQIALLCIDLDRFKYVNDTHGHDVGDLFLQQVSVRLAARFRASDTLARTGGDEFTAVIADVRDRGDVEKLASWLVTSLQTPFEVEGHTLYGGVSIGIALYPDDGSDADSLHRSADRAMYRAKAEGRNTIRFYSSNDARDQAEGMEIELHLHRAIEQGNFAVHFQPQFTCDRRLSGFEALLRFRHPKLGVVPPSRFIPIAEESGLILPIGEWVLHEVCRQIAEWQKKGMHPIRVAVNVSPLQFARADFCQTVVRALKSSRVNPELLELEITEGVLMCTGHDSARQIDLIAETGVRLAVDDFGTGYSSLGYLHQLPIHALKIDRSFVTRMLEPGGTRAIVEAIISLSHGLGLQTVAEGVELDEQLAILRAAGCDLIQGHIYAPALPAFEASRLLWEDTMSEHGTIRGREPETPGSAKDRSASAAFAYAPRRGRS
jgi:diguanylate cyclase (GGDEF)-like protein/PAS domain S-box-containing protein